MPTLEPQSRLARTPNTRSHMHWLDPLKDPFAPSRPRLTDPAEPWEIPVGRAEAVRIGNRGLAGHPYRPSRPDDIPVGAAPALETVCGSLGLERLFVLPRTSRSVDGHRSVLTPTQVLGFGEAVIALWIDDAGGSRVLTIPLDRLAAIDDRCILLYGRLALVGWDTTIVIRYNTVARDALRENLLDVRRRLATTSVPTEAAVVWPPHHAVGPPTEGQAKIPYKWAYLLDFNELRIDPRESAIVAVGDVRERPRGRAHPASGIAVLSPRELVIAAEPPDDDASAHWGVELLSVPRPLLDALSFDGRSLTVRVGSDATGRRAAISRPLDPSLAAAMREAFRGTVRWE